MGIRKRNLGLSAGLVLFLPFASAQTFVSPWDGHAPALTGVSYPCPAPPSGYDRSFDPGPGLVTLATQVIDAADTYRRSGSREAAECAIGTLGAMARVDAMDRSKAPRTLFFVESETLNAAAIAYLKIRQSGVVTPQEKQAVEPWLVQVARRQQDFFDTFLKKYRNQATGHDHRLFLASYAVMSAAIATNDSRLYDWAISAFHEGANQIDTNGRMLWERCPNGNTAKCHLQAASSLVLIAEYGAYNGDNLYAYKHGVLHLLVASATQGLADPQTFSPFSDGEPQHLPRHCEPWEIGWAEPYQRRFPQPAIAQLLTACSSHNFIGWGGAPPG